MIEIHDYYSKQTYRNRCNIYGANGQLSLSIPVLKGPEHKSRVKDIKIDDSKNWKKMHWKGIESAYMHSPFFEFYMDEIQSVFGKIYSFLIDLNTDILHLILSHLEIEPYFRHTDHYMEESGEKFTDYRELIHPKKDLSSDQDFKPQ